jgi:hypothetical protein
MAESISRQKFYGRSKMHYMASKAASYVTGQIDEDREHNKHLSLQEHMRNPTAYHAEIMGDIMYLQQALYQPDSSHFVDAVIQEVNGHFYYNNWVLTKRSKVPETLTFFLQSGPCATKGTSLPMRSRSTRPGSTFTVGNRFLA